MKRYVYKFLAVLIIVIIAITSITATTVSATNAETGKKYIYQDAVVSKYFTPQDIIDNGYTITYYELYEYYSFQNTEKAIPDYVLFYLSIGASIDGPCAKVIGDYYLEGSNGHYPTDCDYGICVPETEEVYSLSKAYALQIEGIENVFTEAGVGRLIGDMDEDRKLTIKDATHIQKGLVGLIEFSGDPIEAFIWTENPPLKYAADFNRDCELNIKDATAIQKKLANVV